MLTCIFSSISYIFISLTIHCNLLLHYVFTARCTIMQSAVLRLHDVRLSVCLSLTLLDQDHLDWKSWKLNARTISPNLRSSQPKGHPPTPTETWGNLGTLEVVGGKSGVLEHKSGNISETRKDRGKVTMEGQANSATLFRTVPLLTPYGLRFANFWGSPPHPKLESLLSHDG